MPGSFDRLRVGERFVTPTLTIDPVRAREVIAWAVYVHPLFTDPDIPARAGITGSPVPGEMVLLLLGGLAEQTGVFDDTTLALVELEKVRFMSVAVLGDTVHLEMLVTKRALSPSRRRGFVTIKWTCLNQRSEMVLEAEALFAFRTEPSGA